ncbi:hypothetical protein HC891_24900 [Candidatus Gracilibacteria bacterium]|nr:hypothetical protein [Candidatus Gracilibacteria bacterium]
MQLVRAIIPAHRQGWAALAQPWLQTGNLADHDLAAAALAVSSGKCHLFAQRKSLAVDQAQLRIVKMQFEHRWLGQIILDRHAIDAVHHLGGQLCAVDLDKNWRMRVSFGIIINGWGL